jgi:hypothetical protein
MNTLTKSDIGRAVDAIRELSDVIEKLHKSTWPDADRSDVLRKAFLGDDPRASVAMRAAQAAMEDLNARLDRLEAAQPRKPAYSVSGGQS